MKCHFYPLSNLLKIKTKTASLYCFIRYAKLYNQFLPTMLDSSRCTTLSLDSLSPTHPALHCVDLTLKSLIPAASVSAQKLFTITLRLCQCALETHRLTDQVFQTHGVLHHLFPTTMSNSHSMLMPTTRQHE